MLTRKLEGKTSSSLMPKTSSSSNLDEDSSKAVSKTPVLAPVTSLEMAAALTHLLVKSKLLLNRSSIPKSMPRISIRVLFSVIIISIFARLV